MNTVAWLALVLLWIVATIGVTIMWPDMRQAGRDVRARLRRIPPELERTVDLGPHLAHARAHVPARVPRQRAPRHRR